MKPYYEFTEYVAEHISEISYDTISSLRNEWKPGLTLSQDDITLVARISQQNCLALLRAYHNWVSEEGS